MGRGGGGGMEVGQDWEGKWRGTQGAGQGGGEGSAGGVWGDIESLGSEGGGGMRTHLPTYPHSPTHPLTHPAQAHPYCLAAPPPTPLMLTVGVCPPCMVPCSRCGV